MTDLINKELNRCAERLSKNEPGSEGYEKLLSCIERLRYIEGMIPAGAPTWVGCGETAETEENGETVEMGPTHEPGDSGLCGESRSSEASEAGPKGADEGCGACDGDSAAPEAEAAEGTTEPEWTKTAVREILAEAKLAGVSVASILPRFNATRLSEVDPSRYGDLVAAVRQEMT